MTPADREQARALEQLGNVAIAELHVSTIVREHIQRVLGATRNNISLAGRLLGLHRRTLQRVLQQGKLRGVARYEPAVQVGPVLRERRLWRYDSAMARRRLHSALEPELLAVTQRFTKELAALMGRHLAAEVARAMASQSKHMTSRRRGRPSAISDAMLGDVLAVVKKSPGLRSEEIYKKLPQQSPRLLKAALAKLRESKKVKTSGQRRATKYRAA